MIQVEHRRYSPVSGIVVVSVPAQVDITGAEQLRVTLLRVASDERPTVLVVDLTQTRSCDSAGLRVLVRAHRRALAEGAGLRLIIPGGSPLAQVVALTGLYRFIPCFGSLDQALGAAPAAPAWPLPAHLVHDRQP
jgi:anti-sigma B factor antagonist